MKLHLPLNLLATLMSALSLWSVSGVSFATGESISINFGSNSGSIGTTQTAGAISATGDHWNQFVASTEATGQFLKDNSGTSTDLKLTWSSKNIYHAGNGTTGDAKLLTGYLDDGDGVNISVSDIDYLTYGVYIYCNTDTANVDFSSKTVNGLSYTGSGTTTTQGSGAWGSTGNYDTIVLGTNALYVEGQSSSHLTINSEGDGGNRGCISGIQIVNTYTGTKKVASLAGGSTSTWTSSSLGGVAWSDSTAAAGTYAGITVSGTAILNIATGETRTTDAITLTGGDLTVNGGTLALIGPGTLRVDSADKKLTINSTLSGKATINGAGTVVFGQNQTLSGLSGAGNLDIGSTTLTVGDTGNFAFAGSLSGTAGSSFIKTGTGKQALTAFDITRYLGTIDIQNGVLEIGNSLNTFTSTKISMSNNGILSLNMSNNGEGNGNSIINLGDNFKGNLMINSGVFALNNNEAAKSSNIGTAKLHLKGGTTFLIRNGINDGSNVFANDILLGSGDTYLRTYGGVNATISSNITGEGVTSTEGNVFHRTDGGTISLTGVIDYKGLFKSEAGTTNFKGNTTLGALQVTGGITNIMAETTLGALQVTGGTTNIMAETTLGACEISGGVANFQSIVKSEHLYIGSATANLESGAHMTVGQLRFSEGNNTNSVFNVKEGSRLDLTGTNNDHSTGASFLLNHWPGSSKFNVLGGQVNALGAIMYTSWDGFSTTQVSGGTLNVKGIYFGGQKDVSKGSVFLGTNDDGTVSNELATGRINIGESGIAALKDGDSKLVLGHGTIGALADWATNTGGGSKKITVLSALGTTFDTQDVDNATIGHTITLNHDIMGTGKIIKTGKGNLILNGSNSNFAGGTDINGGTLTANHANALGTGYVTLNKGTLNATNKHLSNHKITINGGTVSNLAKSSTGTLKEVTLSATSQEIDNKTITIDNSFLQATTAGSVNIGLGNQIIMMGGSTVMLGASNSSNVVTIVLGQNNLTTAAMTMTSGDTLSFAGTWTLDLSQFTGAVEKTDYTFHIISLPNNSTLFNLTEFKGFTITGNDGFTVKDSTAVLNELKNTGTVTLSYKGGSTPAVPEPSTVTLTLVALTSLLLRRRRAN